MVRLLQVAGALGRSLVALDAVHASMHHVLELVRFARTHVYGVVLVVVWLVVPQACADLQPKLVTFIIQQTLSNKTKSKFKHPDTN